MKITIDYCPGILKKVNCFFQECGWGIAYDQALDTALEQTSRIFKEFLITPLVQNIKNPLHSLASANLESIYLIEEDISDILLDLIDNKIAEIVNTLLSKTEVENISKELASVLTLKSTKEHVSKFFKHFSVKDLFAEVYRLFNNEPLLEKQQFYLYFCDITVYKTTFPIFYIPLELERVPAGFEVSFDSTIYLNKKAIDYVVQEYNKVNEKTGSLKTIHDRVIYLSEEMQGHLIGTIDRIMREISDFFDLRNYLELDNPRDQNIKGMFVSISNSCYLSLFDKSDESLINDYEEILELLESGSSKLADSFNRLINSFIHDDPISLINEVESEWDETDTPNRLVHSTPIPLNSEQRQVISSLKNPNCKYVTVEGPPGTGKSHTITAVLFNAVIEGQSVLVLSDKKEALDVVENKISESINKVRIDKNFQNPILRLGKSGSTYNQILSTTSIKDIKTYHRAYKKEASSSRINKEEMINNLKNLLKKTIVNYEKIKLEDIEEFQLLEAKIHESDNYPLDFNEIFEKKDAVFDLKEIRNNVHALHKSISGENGPVVKIFANLNKNNQSLDSFQNFIRLLEIVEELKLENKNTQKVLANFYSFSEEDYQNL
ncbi:MAG: hypothetical protein GY730_04735, partial [bacterium]|nr:hypothetical protein [bacterium]